MYITGDFPDGGVFLVRFDASGNVVWERVWGAGSSSLGEAVAVAADGSVYIAGQTRGFGAGNGDAFLAKFAADGTLLWDRTLGGSNFDAAVDVAVAPDGSIYIAGHAQFFANDAFVAKFSPDGTLLWNRAWREGTIADESAALGVAAAPDGSVYLTGRASRSGAGQNVFLVRFTADGALVWQRTWGAGLDAAHNVAVGFDGNIYVTGNTGFGQGGGDAFVLKFLPSGMVRGAATWGTVNTENGESIAASPDRTICVAGVVRSAPPYVFARAVTATRTPEAFLGTPTATVTVPDATVGFPTGTVTMPNGSLTFAGANDAMLLKLRP